MASTNDRITGVYGTSSKYGFKPETRELNVEVVTARSLNVTANNHASLFRMQYRDSGKMSIEVRVGTGIGDDSGTNVEANGSCIIFVQESEYNQIEFVPEAGISIIGSGQLKSFGEGATVTLISLDANTWLLGGDVLPSEVVVNG